MDDSTEANSAIAAEYAAILHGLFNDALAAAPFEVVCTMLRVGGYQMEQWDPFEETLAALDDYSWMLDMISTRGPLSEELESRGV